MARLARVKVFSADEVAVVHVMNRVVRRCFLLGDDPVNGKSYDHGKVWIEDLLKRFAAAFGMSRPLLLTSTVQTSCLKTALPMFGFSNRFGRQIPAKSLEGI